MSRMRSLFTAPLLVLAPPSCARKLAQEVLPFPPTPSASTAGLTIQDSTYKKRVEPKQLAEGRTEHPHHPDGRRRAGHALDLTAVNCTRRRSIG